MKWVNLCIAVVFCLGLFGVLRSAHASTDAAAAPATAQPTVVKSPVEDPTKVGGTTDAEANQREENAISSDGLNAAERAAMLASEEKHEFQAEVTRLMDIIINALYSNREIFMRELISNSADACDKIRFESLTDPTKLGKDTDLEIRVQFDKDTRTITVTDKGIGMTKQGLIKNLGVVAHSGTTEFLDKVSKGGASALSLIGQFGVGFYSVYLVADEVTVISKHNDDDQYIWKSKADKTFSVFKDPRGNTLGRGTSVTLHLKEDASDFLNEAEIKRIITKYSEFITFPIHLLTHKEEEKEVVDEEAEAKEAADAEKKKADDAEKKEGDEEKKDDELDVKEDEDDKKDDKKPKMKKVKETVAEWQQLNTNKAIWLRDPDEVKREEYDGFYKSLTKDEKGMLDVVHFKAEGELTFTSILYIPKKAPEGYYDKFYEKSNALKLYVRRVMISDQFEDFMPRYMSFIKGVVDSDDLPLNVSRETLAQNRVLKVMGKKLTRRGLTMLKKMAERSAKLQEEYAEQKDSEKKDEDKTEEEKKADATKKEEREMYDNFWTEFGKSIKLGVIDDRTNRVALAALMRFASSKSDGKTNRSLHQYINDKPDKQKYIYYITGDSLKAVENSPMLEKLKRRGYEVLYMTDPLDEYVVQQLSEFENVKLQSVTKEGFKIDDEDNKKQADLDKEYEDLTTYLKGVYGDRVEKVVVSMRLSTSPAVVSTGKYGWTAYMEKIMKAQTFADREQQQWMAAKKHFEINPRHPLIKELRVKAKADPNDQATKDLALLLLDSALLVSGFAIDNPADVSSRMLRSISVGLNVDPNAAVEEDDDEPVADSGADAGADGGDSGSSSDDSGAAAAAGGDDDSGSSDKGADKDEL